MQASPGPGDSCAAPRLFPLRNAPRPGRGMTPRKTKHTGWFLNLYSHDRCPGCRPIGWTFWPEVNLVWGLWQSVTDSAWFHVIVWPAGLIWPEISYSIHSPNGHHRLEWDREDQSVELQAQMAKLQAEFQRAAEKADALARPLNGSAGAACSTSAIVRQ